MATRSWGVGKVGGILDKGYKLSVSYMINKFGDLMYIIVIIANNTISYI